MMGSRIYQLTLGALVNAKWGRLALLWSIPAVWIIVFNLGPIFQVLRISLLDKFPLKPGQNASYTFNNYFEFFQQKLYFVPFLRSFALAFLVTLGVLLVVYPTAYFVAKVIRPRGRSRALLILMLPFWAGEIIRTFSVIMLLANRGAINGLLQYVGIVDRPIPLLYNYFSLGFGLIYIVCLYMLLPLYSALEKIPSSLLEAAADLGAGSFTCFRRIILPLSRDGIVSGCSLVFLTCVGVFATPVLLGGPGTSLFPETISAFFHGASDKWPIGAAFAVLLLIGALGVAGTLMWVVSERGTRRT